MQDMQDPSVQMIDGSSCIDQVHLFGPGSPEVNQPIPKTKTINKGGNKYAGFIC